MSDIMELSRVKQWSQEYPREWWAFENLPSEDSLRDAVLASILQQRPEDAAIDLLLQYASALEVRERAVKMGTMKAPPQEGHRRQLEIHVTGMHHMEKDGRPCFEVQFSTDEGWSGYFHTTNPKVVESINKHKGNEPLSVVGEVERKLYDFLVVLGARIHIV